MDGKNNRKNFDNKENKISEIKKVIYVSIPLNIQDLYIYSIPDNLLIEDVIGKRVLVDFNNQKIAGYAIKEAKWSDDYPIKEIIKIIDEKKVFNQYMINFAFWIADYYFSSIGEVLSLMIPKKAKIRNNKKIEEINNINTKNVVLSSEQQKIYDGIIKDITGGIKNFYIYGVTGSGKTEIYIKLIEKVLKDNKQVIFLVPEIVLSYQTLNKLKERFGNKCSIMHSNLKPSQRYNEYLRIFNQEVDIVIGPRSAIFAPLFNIGLIIIDEENESSYKSETSPRYHTRTVAQYLSKKNNSILVLGSATPSIESFYYSQKGFFKLYQLLERYGGAKLPDIEIIDCSLYASKKNLTEPLIKEINLRLQKKEQIVLLQNRRGFSTLLKCANCDYIFKCARCDVTLTYHKSNEKLMCHYCGYKTNIPVECPVCKEKKIIKIGVGTQKIEDEISMLFKYARIKRIDLDSMKSHKDFNEIFKEIENNEIDILIGTQMLAKGLHFPNIKLVGIINADILLNIPDYKASERTFSLITQVAGRSGRVGDKGYVLIQTINPDHYSIICAKNNNYFDFYNKEIFYRQMMNFPPFCRLLRLVIRGKDNEKVEKDIEKLSLILKNNNIENNIEILGPAQCLILKLNNNYRHQILLKSKDIKYSQELVRKSIKNFKLSKNNFLEIDVDPVDLF